MSTTALDLEAVRAQFPALASGVAFLDGPGGTQCPQSVIDAIAALPARVERESRRRVRRQPAQRRARRARARHRRTRFLGCRPEETVFGQNMTTLNFALTRALGRTLAAGDEILVTRLDHDGNVAPWLELAHDLDLVSASLKSTKTRASTSPTSSRS